MSITSLLEEAKLSPTLLENRGEYIKVVRQGISGAILPEAIKELGIRDNLKLRVLKDKLRKLFVNRVLALSFSSRTTAGLRPRVCFADHKGLVRMYA